MVAAKFGELRGGLSTVVVSGVVGSGGAGETLVGTVVGSLGERVREVRWSLLWG